MFWAEKVTSSRFACLQRFLDGLHSSAPLRRMLTSAVSSLAQVEPPKSGSGGDLRHQGLTTGRVPSEYEAMRECRKQKHPGRLGGRSLLLV